MKTFVIFLGCLALVAGIGVNWGTDKFGDRDDWNRMHTDEHQRHFPGLFGFTGSSSDRTNDDRNAGLHRDTIFDKDIIIDREHVGHGRTGDLRATIMNDENIFHKQKFILDVMRNVYKTSVSDSTRDVRLAEGETNYVNFDRVIPFFRMVETNILLPRGHVFSINDHVHRHQAVALFNVLYYSKDFNVFQRNVLWARNNVNEDMFIHILTCVIFQRHDLAGIKIPSHYEVVPHKFHTDVTITKAVQMRMANVHDDIIVVKNNFTSDILAMNDESKLTYLTEDVGWNLFHFYLFMQYPSWLGGEEFGLYRHKRGERYLYLIQQILARYNMERLSHGMGPIEDIDIHVPIKTGYNSFLRHFNGLGYSVRKNYYDVYTTEDYHLITRMTDFKRRLSDAIDKGYCTTKDGVKIDLYKVDGADILGNMIQSNKDSVNDRYYGGIVRILRTLLGGGHVKNVDHNNVLTSAMEDYETALRDPVTYQMYKRVWKLFYQYKNNLHHYTTNDLLLKGVRVIDIHTTKLMTYFDYFDVDVSTIVDHDIRTQTKDAQINNVQAGKLVFARHTRLNHKPFIVNIDVVSDVAQKVVVRLFIGPKFDHMGKILTLNHNRDNFMEMDRFMHDLPAGHVTIKRDSREFRYVTRDRTTYIDLYKKILANKDVNTLLNLNVVESHCGFPDRLLLPRGWENGMPMQIYVIITRAKDQGKLGPGRMTRCGRDLNWLHTDDFNIGFPFDRHIEESVFYTTNMLFKDVLIYHKGLDTTTDTHNYMDRIKIDDTGDRFGVIRDVDRTGMHDIGDTSGVGHTRIGGVGTVSDIDRNRLHSFMDQMGAVHDTGRTGSHGVMDTKDAFHGVGVDSMGKVLGVDRTGVRDGIDKMDNFHGLDRNELYIVVDSIRGVQGVDRTGIHNLADTMRRGHDDFGVHDARRKIMHTDQI